MYIVIHSGIFHTPVKFRHSFHWNVDREEQIVTTIPLLQDFISTPMSMWAILWNQEIFIQPSSTLPDILRCHTIYRLLIRAHWQRCYGGYIQDILKIELRRNGFMSILFIYLRYVMLYKLSYSIHWRMTDSRSENSYYKQIDGLRFISVFGVMVAHWYQNSFHREYLKELPFGTGVVFLWSVVFWLHRSCFVFVCVMRPKGIRKGNLFFPFICAEHCGFSDLLSHHLCVVCNRFRSVTCFVAMAPDIHIEYSDGDHK